MVETLDTNELQALVQTLLQRIDQLETRVRELEAQNNDLKARLALTSINSHKPPSTAGYAKKPASQKPPAGKVGGQTGHSGHTLELVAQPDSSQQHWPHHCPICQKELPQQGTIVARRQVFDLPQPRLQVHEYQLMETTCQCGCQVRGLFPESVKAPSNMGLAYWL